MRGGLSLMTNLPSRPSAIFGKSPFATVRFRSLARRLRARAIVSGSESDARIDSISMREYHTSSAGLFEYFAIRSRYERTHAIAASRWSAAEKPFDRAACTKLAA